MFPPPEHLTGYDRVLWVIPADARAEALKSVREARLLVRLEALMFGVIQLQQKIRRTQTIAR